MKESLFSTFEFGLLFPLNALNLILTQKIILKTIAINNNSSFYKAS